MESFISFILGALAQREQELNQTLAQLEGLLSQNPQGGGAHPNPHHQAQLAQMLMRAQTQMGQLDDLARQRYENRVGELMGMAASAGIDWSP